MCDIFPITFLSMTFSCSLKDQNFLNKLYAMFTFALQEMSYKCSPKHRSILVFTTLRKSGTDTFMAIGVLLLNSPRSI